MKDELDDSLKRRIADIFDNYEDDSAHEGWLLLREKYPEKEKRRPVLWLWWGSIAAVLLVVLGVGIWLNNGNPKLTPNAASVIKKPVVDSAGFHKSTTEVKEKDSKLANATSINTSKKTISDTPGNYARHINPNPDQSANQYAIKQHTNNRTKTDLYLSKNQVKSQHHKPGDNKPNTSERSLSSKIKPENDNDSQSVLAASTNRNSNPIKNSFTDSTQFADKINTSKAKPAEIAKAIVKEPKKPLFSDKPINEPKPKLPVDDAVKYSIYAATYVNYAKGSDNEFNVGVGLSSEIKLSGRLKLLTGVAINQNSLNYQTALPQKAGGYLTASLARNRGNLYAAPAIAPSFTTLTATTPVLQNYQANLLGLDIPLNLKYQLSKSDTYVSAGISSGTYLNETYQFVYNYPAATDNQNTKTHNAFGTFDFARTLNFSFGMGYPLGKRNRLTVEPFVKYPLSGLGSQDLKFGAGGVNLKLNFLPSKK